MQSSLLITSPALKLKSKPGTIDFPTTWSIRREYHIPKSGVISPPMLASGLPQSDRISNLRLWTPCSYWGFSKTSPFPVSLPILIRDNTLGKKTCKMTQMVKCINRYFIPPIKEFISAIFGPKLQRAFKHFKQFPRKFLCVARSFHYILLGFPFISF